MLARVTRIAARQATVAILAVGDRACAEEAQGLIRVQDVRATEKDRVQVAGSFRPGDVVRAVVVSFFWISFFSFLVSFGEGGLVCCGCGIGTWVALGGVEKDVGKGVGWRLREGLM